MADRERTIRLRVLSDFREATEGIDRLRARQQEMHRDTQRIDNDLKARQDARAGRNTAEAAQVSAHTKLLDKLLDSRLKNARAESAAATLRELNNKREMKYQEDYRRSLLQSAAAYQRLMNAPGTNKDKVIEMKAKLDDKLLRDELRRAQTEVSKSRPQIVFESVLDRVGIGKVKRQIEELERKRINIKAQIEIQQDRHNMISEAVASGRMNSKELGRSENALQGLQRELHDAESALGGLIDRSNEGGESMGRFQKRMMLWAKAAVPLIAGVVGALGPLIGELIAAGAAAGAMIGTFGGAAIVVGVGLVAAFQNSMEAIKQFGKAQEELSKAANENLTALQVYQRQLEDMTPAGREFTEFVTGNIIPAFDSLKAVAESSFLGGITDGWEKLMGYVSQFSGLVYGAGQAIGEMVDDLATFLTEGDGVDDMKELFDGVRNTIDELAPGFEQLGEAIMTIFGQGADSATTFAESITDVLTNFNEWIQDLANTGELAAFFQKGEQYLEDFLGLIGDLGDLITEAFGGFTEDGTGSSMLGFLRSGVQALTDMFDAFNDSKEAMIGLKAIGAVVFGTLYAVIAGVSGIVWAVAEAIGWLSRGIVELGQKLGLIDETTEAQKRSNDELARNIELRKQQQSIDVGGAKEELGDYLSSIQEGGGRFNDMAAAASSAQHQINALASSQLSASKAAEDYNDKTAKLHDTVLKASRAERDANEALKKIVTDNKESLAQDQKDITEARENEAKVLAAGLDNVEEAEDRLEKAHLAAARAQDSVNKARKEALQDLINLRKEVERGALNERKGALALRQAQEAYYRLLKDPTASYEEREAARLSVEEKRMDVTDTIDTNKQNRKDLVTAERKGVEGSDKVKDAIQARNDALKAEKKATEDVAEARRVAEENYKKALEATQKAEKKLSDDRKQFALDERDARERAAEAHKAYLSSLKEEQKQLDILKQKKKEAFDDQALKRDQLKQTLMSQDFAGYGASGANKKMSSKDADEYIKLLNGLDVGTRNALEQVGLPNSLGAMRQLVSSINTAKKASPKASATQIVQNALNQGMTSKSPVQSPSQPKYVYDPATKKYVENPSYIQAPLAPSKGEKDPKTGAILPEGFYRGTDGKIHQRKDAQGNLLGQNGKLNDVIPKATAATNKELEATGKASGKAFGTGLNAGITDIKPNIREKLRQDISGDLPGSAIQGTFKDDLEIKSPSKVFFRFGGAMMQGLVDGIANSQKTIQEIVVRVLTGLGTGSIRGQVTADFELAKGRSEWFFKMAGAMMVGFVQGIDNSTKTVKDAILRFTRMVFSGFQGPLDTVGDLFSAMMDEAFYNFSVGANNILNALRLYLTEINKVTSGFDINLTPGDVKDLAIPKLNTPAGVKGFASGGSPGYDAGGKIFGSGGGTEDKVIARVSPREWIQPEHSVNYYGDNVMEAIRTRRIPREALQGFATGGPMTNAAKLYTSDGKLTDDQIDYIYRGDEKRKQRALQGDDSAIAPPGFWKGGLASLGELFGFATGGQVIAKVKQWLTGTADKLPYVMGSHGPKAYDCSSLVGEVWARLTGAELNKRRFTTSDEKSWLDNHGFKKGNLGGKATFVVGYRRSGSSGHTVGRLDGINFAARSAKLGISAPHTDKPENYPNVYYLPAIDALKGDSSAPVSATPSTGGSATAPVDASAAQRKEIADKVKKIDLAGLAKAEYGPLGRVFNTMLKSIYGTNTSVVKRLAQNVAERILNSGAYGGDVDFGKIDLGEAAKLAEGNKKVNDNMRAAYAKAQQMGVSNKLRLALFETGLVESGFKNYANKNVPVSLRIPHDAVGSDHDSVGIMQQRVGRDGKGAGWGTVYQAMDPAHAAQSFLKAALKKDKKGMTAGVLAQKVQVSAFPTRYTQARGKAAGLLAMMDPKLNAKSFAGFAEGGSPSYVAAPMMPLANFAGGGSVGVGRAEAPARQMGAAAANIVNNNNSSGGFNIQNFNVHNPLKEPASDSLYRRVSVMKSIYDR